MIDFIPTVIVGFYRKSVEDVFIQHCKIFAKRFPEADILGCSSAGNISNERPYIETTGQFPCVFFCLEIEKDAYRLEIFSENERVTVEDEQECRYGAVLFSGYASLAFEQTLASLPEVLGTDKVFGAVAGADDVLQTAGSIFLNGTFYKRHFLLWLIDDHRYRLSGMSMHLFRPVGLPLEITAAEGNRLRELNGRPALEVLESLAGHLDETAIESFGYPLFLQKTADGGWEEAPLASLISIDREDGSVILYRDVSVKEYLKIGIMITQEEQLARLSRMYTIADPGSLSLLFHCIGISKNLGMMEYLYLEDIKRHLDITFAGCHTFGEIGCAAVAGRGGVKLHNQTITIAVLSERENHADK